ncbi:MAG: carbohydrate ABC transporter permease [Clostridia bacterium]|nr:carbohydrate ABC transporter permease [Clostridia bacterium]
MESTPIITKETKNRLVVDYEGKLSFKERLLRKLKTSNTWIKVLINIFRFIFMLGVSYVIIYPFISKIANSFMTVGDIVDTTVIFIPKNFTTEIYRYIFTENHYLEAFFNTVLLSLMCAIIQTFIAAIVGYGIAKFKFKGNKIVSAFVIITMVIPHSALELALIQHFTNFDIFQVISWNYPSILELITGGPLKLQGTFWPMAILSFCGLGFKNGLYIYMMRQFFKGVPDELEESAYVDGSGVFRTFFQIILPLSVPMMITIFLFAFSWQWTDGFYTEIFFMNQDTVRLMPDVYQNIPKSLATDFSGTTLYNSVIRNTAGLMIIAPLLVVYLFCQKYLVQGIERSGLVG